MFNIPFRTKGRGKGVGGLGGGKGEGKGKADSIPKRNDRTGCRAGLAVYRMTSRAGQRRTVLGLLSKEACWLPAKTLK
jgi:hypothetical protein